MKKLLVILIAALFVLTGCEYAENWTQEVLLSTEEPLPEAITRVTAEPTEVPTETPFVPATPAPDATATPIVTDPVVTVADGKTTVNSKQMGFSMTVSNPEWTSDPNWDRYRELPTDFVFFHKTPETGGNLIGVIVYSYNGGDMEKLMNDKIESVMSGVDDYTREGFVLGSVTAVRTVQTMTDGLHDYVGTNVFWIDGDRIIRITAAAEAACKDEVWSVVEDMINTYERFEG